MSSLGQNEQGYDHARNEVDGTVVVLIPAGPITMGSDDGSDLEKPARQVSLPGYYIGKTEVTNGQFQDFVNETGYDAGEKWKDYAQEWGDLAPVVGVGWHDAEAYCRWAGLRLPTEAEWEKASPGADGREYPWGNSKDDSLAWCYENSGSKAHPVGSKPGDVSPYGCLDMGGNIREWTSSWLQKDPNSDDSADFRILRGGCWLDSFEDVEGLRCSSRSGGGGA